MIVWIVVLGCVPGLAADAFQPSVSAHNALANDAYPKWIELKPLFGKHEDSREVSSLVQKYKLKESTKGPSGSFTAKNHSYTLLYRSNKISTIILDVLPPPKGYGEADWTEYKEELPFGIQKADKQAEYAMRFGKPVGKSGTFFRNEKFEIWAHFRKQDGVVSELYISPLETPIGSPRKK